MTAPQSAERSLQDIRDGMLGAGGASATGVAIAAINKNWAPSAITTTNGSAQDIFPDRSTTGRGGLLIQNNAGGDMWIRFGGTAAAAAPSIKLAAGFAVVFEPPGIVDPRAVSLFGPADGAFTALEV